MAGAGRTRQAIDLLLSAGELTKDAHRALLDRVKKGNQWSEELLLADGSYDELTLLRKLAALHRTKFVTSERLLRVDVPQSTLGMIPKRLAETEMFFPVSFDAASSTLQVVTPDPGEDELVAAAKLASGARHVNTFFARPTAVLALISKHYDRNRSAFDALEREWATARGGGTGQQFNADGTIAERSSSRLEVAPPAGSSGQLPIEPTTSSVSVAVAAEPSVALELVAALVTLLESTRGELADHSAFVSRYAKLIAQRLGLAPERVAEIAIAGHLHDLGKHGPPDAPFHLTLLGCQASATQRERATELVSAPIRMLDTVDLAHPTRQAILQMYERIGPGGIPGRVQGTDISLGARILTVADCFADLTKNSKNPYGRIVSPDQACGVLAKASGSLFDETVVSALRSLVPRRASSGLLALLAGDLGGRGACRGLDELDLPVDLGVLAVPRREREVRECLRNALARRRGRVGLGHDAALGVAVVAEHDLDGDLAPGAERLAFLVGGRATVVFDGTSRAREDDVGMLFVVDVVALRGAFVDRHAGAAGRGLRVRHGRAFAVGDAVLGGLARGGVGVGHHGGSAGHDASAAHQHERSEKQSSGSGVHDVLQRTPGKPAWNYRSRML